MIRKLHTKSSAIAGVFVLGLLSALICDYLCDVGVIEFGKTSHQHEIPKDDHPDLNQSSHGDDHTHFFDFLFAGSHMTNQVDEHNHSSDHEHNSDHKHADGEDDACCEEEMDNLFLGLFKQASQDFDFVQTFIFINAFFYQYLINDTADHKTNITYINPSPPPGPDIRVLIQSFLK